ncbi:PREDICTED: toll-like receptor 4 [Nanorana parkeri]|uniref:toll-like receptor 4 n=1 Tax=Nanorana parkeri TaxID=125878 RepID=UPI000854D3CD|nr:PREDICTED: toll-like receptor 4 [Nanorana parkeri]
MVRNLAEVKPETAETSHGQQLIRLRRSNKMCLDLEFNAQQTPLCVIIEGSAKYFTEIHQVSVNCCNCNLSSVPADLPKETKSLDLSFNPLKHISGLARLSRLQILDLTRCGITSIEDNTFAGLGTLHTLILTGNPIKHWSQVAFTGLYSLTKLVVVETSLASLSELRVEHLRSLQELNAAKNRIDRLYVPSFLFHLHTLDLRANNISKINREDVENLRRANTSNLSLILSQNPIHFIDPGAFWFVALQMLHLKGCFYHEDIMRACLNSLSGLQVQKLVLGHYRMYRTQIYFKENLFEGLCGVDVEEVTINHISLENTYTFFDCMENITSLRFIHASLYGFDNSPFTSNMKRFELQKTFITTVPSFIFSKLKQLKEIRITNNERLTTFYHSLLGVNTLEVLDLSNNKLMMVACCEKQVPGTSLKHLDFSYNSYIGLRSFFLDMPHLLSLNLSHSKVDSVGQFPIFMSLNNLTYLDLSYTSCHFMIHCSFCGLYNLVELRVSHTTFAPDVLGSVFHNLSSLRLLDMSSCDVQHIPNETFEHLKGLQVLNLSKNKLIELMPPVLLSLSALWHFNVSGNNIQGLSNGTLQVLSRSLAKVDLSRNPYDCSCTQEQFLVWVNEQSAKDLNFSTLMTCKTPEHLQGTLLREVHLNCSWTLIYISLLVIVVIMFLALLMYHLYFKYCFLFFCFCRRDYQLSVTENTYDAFVIHSSLDEEWVRNELLPELENGVPSFQLCVHFRNFEAGKLILENIFYNGICCSRNALVILSPSFIESKWCSFELKLAMFWTFLENQCGVILILLKPVTEDQLKDMYVLRKHLSRNTYLKWDDDQKNKKEFWKSLRQALGRGQRVAVPLLGHNSAEICQRQNKQNKETTQL